MVYSKAAKYSKSTPCSNVPLSFGFERATTNILEVQSRSLAFVTQPPHHKLRASNIATRASVRVIYSKKGGTQMGVPNENTEEWRLNNNMPVTDFYTEWEIEQSRKRAGSILSQSSQSSTKSRQPSPTKKGRLL